MTGPMRLVRAAALGGLGVALAARPRDVVATSCGAPVPPAWLVRVLGVRQLAQELLILAAPTRSVLLGAATTDALHAASMGAAALIWPKYRRPALTSAVIASGSSVRLAARARSRAAEDLSGSHR